MADKPAPPNGKLKRLNITVDEDTVKKAREIAMGNLSMGIRIAVRDHKLKK